MPHSKNVENKKVESSNVENTNIELKRYRNVRTTGKQKRIETLYQRHNDGLINSSQLLTGLSYLVGNKIWY